MTHLTYLGIRVRNKGMSKLTSGFFKELMTLDNLERFLLSEMILEDPAPFIEFVVSRPKLQELTIRRSEFDPAILETIRKAKPELEIVVEEE